MRSVIFLIKLLCIIVIVVVYYAKESKRHSYD